MATAPEDLNAAAFLAMLPRLLPAYEGQYVLIHSGERIGVFQSEDEAVEAGHLNFQLEPFFVAPVLGADQLAASPRIVSL